MITKEESTKYLNAISGQIFNTKFEKLAPAQIETLKMNLMARRDVGDLDQPTFDQLLKTIILPKISKPK